VRFELGTRACDAFGEDSRVRICSDSLRTQLYAAELVYVLDERRASITQRERSARRRGFTGAKLGIRARRSPRSLFALILRNKAHRESFQSPGNRPHIAVVPSHRVTYDESYVCTTICKYAYRVYRPYRYPLDAREFR